MVAAAQVGLTPLANTLSGVTRNALNAIQQLTKGGQALPKGNILDDFANFIKNFGKQTPGKISPGPTITPNIPSKLSTSTKLLIGTTAASTAAIVSVPLLTLTPGGQNLVEQPAKIVDNITKFFTDNPLATVGIVLVGGALLVGALKSK